MCPNETTAPSSRRPRRRRALGSGLAIVLGSLLVGGVTTYAAATASANSQIVTLNGSPALTAGLAPGAPTAATTTTTSTTGTTLPAAVPTVASAGNAVATGSTGVAATQTIGIAILPGTLTVTPTIESVSLSGPDHVGSLSPITVDDARGSLVGWRSTVSLQAVSGLDAAQLASTRLCVSPHPTTLVAGNPADIVRSSPRACAGPGDPIAVFSAAPGGGGGEYSDTAGVALVLPGGGATAGVTASLVVAVG